MSHREVRTEVTGSVWKILVSEGQQVHAGEQLMIIESMKMEIPVVTDDGGVVIEIRLEEGASVSEGDTVATVDVEEGS